LPDVLLTTLFRVKARSHGRLPQAEIGRTRHRNAVVVSTRTEVHGIRVRIRPMRREPPTLTLGTTHARRGTTHRVSHRSHPQQDVGDGRKDVGDGRSSRRGRVNAIPALLVMELTEPSREG
jgi:hypothetical protein